MRKEDFMIKVEVIESFTLNDFKKLKNIVRYNSNLKEEGHLYAKDTFECDKEMADYLLGGNRLNRAFVKVIEVIPEKENIEKKTTTHRRKKSVAQK